MTDHDLGNRASRTAPASSFREGATLSRFELGWQAAFEIVEGRRRLDRGDVVPAIERDVLHLRRLRHGRPSIGLDLPRDPVALRQIAAALLLAAERASGG